MSECIICGGVLLEGSEPYCNDHSYVSEREREREYHVSELAALRAKLFDYEAIISRTDEEVAFLRARVHQLQNPLLPEQQEES